jgi:serpin B
MLFHTDKTPPIVKGNNEFALDLYSQLRDGQGNLFFSPYSLSTALAMTYAGARGQTAEQMATVLHFPRNADQLHPDFAALIRQLQGGQTDGCELHLANALWGQKGHGFRADFLKLIEAHYGAGLREVDFAEATEEARQTINAWVEQQTQDKIKDLLEPGILDSLTRLVLTNAIYFKGAWATPFEHSQTRDGPFLVTPQQRVTVPMMHQVSRFNYLETDDFQVLELTYSGGRLALMIFLPRKVDGLAEFERTLSADNLARWAAKLRSRKVAVELPRFKVTGTFLLNDVLSQMGMPLAFDQMRADFTGMDDGEPGLYLFAVVHKAFVDVNEEGTEAAAATAAVMSLRGISTEKPQVFRADHPFVFLIRDIATSSILFLGRLTNPH